MNIQELKESFQFKDRTLFSKKIEECYGILEKMIEEFPSDEIPELYKFNSGFPTMIKIYEDSFNEKDYLKCKYILDKFCENYEIKRSVNESE